MHGPRLVYVIAALLAMVLAVACGEAEEEGPAGPRATSTPQATPPTAATAGPSTMSVVIDMATMSPLLTVVADDTGELRNDKPALAVGDFNGDGFDDLLIGAPFGDGPDNAREDAGEAYIIFGSPALKGTIDIAQGQQDVTIWGADPGDRLGFSVASGDLNNDGIDDIIVSSPFSNGPLNARTDLGEAYVIFGSADLDGTVDIAKRQQDLSLVGAEGFSLVGDSLAGGDVNGDGIDDLIAGAPFAGRIPGSPPGGPRTELGEVYVVFGSLSLGGLVDVAQNQQDFTMAGAEQFGEFGDAVASGDVNGDGIDDIIVAAEAADGPEKSRANAGEVHVFFGSADLTGKKSLKDSEQDLTVLGAEGRDTLGFSVASGDVNGDGVDDIILTARLASGAGNSRDTSGEAYVIFGSAALGGVVDIAKNDQDVTILGADANDLLGFCAAGDINGDDIDDIILGTGFADGAANTRDGAGEAYVIFGSPTLDATLDLAQGQQNITLLGAEAGDALGKAVISGDLNGDGVYELLAVALDADGPDNSRENAGEIHVIPIGGAEEEVSR